MLGAGCTVPKRPSRVCTVRWCGRAAAEVVLTVFVVVTGISSSGVVAQRVLQSLFGQPGVSTLPLPLP